MSTSYPAAGSSTLPIAWRYSTPAIVLHWVISALIIFMTCLGWFMMTIEHEPEGPWYINLHKSIGLVVFALVLLRMLWRLGHRPEPLPGAMPAWQAKLAGWTQGLLYVCMLVMPITGIVGSLYSRAGLAFFGVALPRWAANRDTAHLFFDIHSITVWVLVALVALHVIGGLKHLLVDRDGVFARMWW